MKIAIIDLGTNTFNLLIGELSGTNFTRIFGTRIAVKLGEGGINRGFISSIPFQRGIDALIEYKKIIENYGVKSIYAFATSAIRSASNGKEFVAKVKEQTGIAITIITGDKEAELIYFGNRKAVPLSEEPVLIMDIGGGSTEFIIANKSRIFWKNSFMLGAARLLERFNPENPILPETAEKLTRYLSEELQPLFQEIRKHTLQCLIGSSGAFDSFVDIVGHAYNKELLHPEKTAYPVFMNHFYEQAEKIIRSTTEERMQTKGLIAMRVDMIVISFLFVKLVLQECKLQSLICSSYSLKEGVIEEIIQSQIS